MLGLCTLTLPYKHYHQTAALIFIETKTNQRSEEKISADMKL